MAPDTAIWMDPVGHVILLCGAPASGKTTVLPELIKAASPIVVVDLDELPDDGSVLGVPVVGPAGQPNWEHYEALWFKILDLITRAGHTVLVLCQIPSLDSALPDRTPQGVPTTWHLLDCDDDLQRHRLELLKWPDDRIAEAVQAARSARAAIASRIMVGPDEAPPDIATRILDRVRDPRPGALRPFPRPVRPLAPPPREDFP